MTAHLLNPALLEHMLLGVDRVKQAFVPSGAMAGGDPAAGGAPPGGDPAAGGMPPGGDPAAGGGAPPSSGGGGGSDAIFQMMQQMQQQIQMLQQGGGAGGAGGPGAASGAAIKPKIDVNVELMQIKNMLAKICDAQGIAIPAQDMVATPDKLLAMSQGQPTAAPGGAAGGAAGGGAIGGMPAMDPMQGAGIPGAEKTGTDYRGYGISFDTDGFSNLVNRVAAIRAIQATRRAA